MTSWIADKIEHWPIDRLIPYARNARTHSPAQIDQIAASIAEFGFTNPILVGSDGVIVAGHGRLEAARKLGLETVPVIRKSRLSMLPASMNSTSVRIKIPPLSLHAGQQRILSNDRRFKVIAAGRRFGKTLLAVEWLALMHGGAIDGKPVAFFSPTYKLLADVWADFERTLRPVTRKANKTEQRIELITGGKIDFWTLEDPDAGRGRKYHRLVIDEAAHARYLKEAWERAISPTLTDYRGEAWFISTPKGMNYFYELFQRGNDPAYPEWASFQMPSTMNPHLPLEEIEQRQRELPELVFRQEYMAEFVTFGGGLVKPEMLADAPCPPGLPVVLGVDLAISERAGADYTAIVALVRDPETGIVYVKEAERHRCGFHEVLQRIKAAAARHSPRVIAVEQTQYQAAVVQELTRTTTLPVRGIRPDKDKVTRFLPLLTRFEQRMVRLDPAGCPAAFRDELLAFPEGQHDDMVDAAAYAFHALSPVVQPATHQPTTTGRAAINPTGSFR